MITTVIIYATNPKYLDKTIDDLLDKTSSNLLGEIIICLDSAEDFNREDVIVLKTANVGKAKAWNQAIGKATFNKLVFIKSGTKFSVDWLDPLVDALNEEPCAIVSPVIHGLDLNLWASDNEKHERYGFRWDLDLLSRKKTDRPESAVVSANCIAINKVWMLDIGLFDDGMVVGTGQDIELCVRNWLLGGYVYVIDESVISVAAEIDASIKSIDNKARIVEAWFKKYSKYFYAAKNLKPTDVNTGRLDKLLQLKDKQSKSIDWYFSNLLPELYGIYDFKNIGSKKRVIVIANGASLDYVDNGFINSFDILIGIDYTALLFDCDYVFTESMSVLTDLRQKYHDKKFVLPTVLENRLIGNYAMTSSVITDCVQYERGEMGFIPYSENPPFINFDSIALVAAHFALFLNPESVTLVGFDNKLIKNKSHSSKISQYDGGELWPDTENTKKRYAYYEFGLDQLSQLAMKVNVPLIRVNHA